MLPVLWMVSCLHVVEVVEVMGQSQRQCTSFDQFARLWRRSGVR